MKDQIEYIAPESIKANHERPLNFGFLAAEALTGIISEMKSTMNCSTPHSRGLPAGNESTNGNNTQINKPSQAVS